VIAIASARRATNTRAHSNTRTYGVGSDTKSSGSLVMLMTLSDGLLVIVIHSISYDIDLLYGTLLSCAHAHQQRMCTPHTRTLCSMKAITEPDCAGAISVTHDIASHTTVTSTDAPLRLLCAVPR
jgi:hypothetical protein